MGFLDNKDAHLAISLPPLVRERDASSAEGFQFSVKHKQETHSVQILRPILQLHIGIAGWEVGYVMEYGSADPALK